MWAEFLYKVSRVVILGYAELLLKMDIRWRASLPAGPVLFAANHPSTTDPILIQLIIKKPMSVMINSKAFTLPLLGPYMRKMGQICVTPGQGENVLEEARQILRKGRSVTIFPEGLLSPLGGGFNPPRSGVGRLALSSGVPVIPVGIYLSEKGCHRIPAMFDGEPDPLNWYLHGPYAITIGKPMHFKGDAKDKDIVRKVSEKIMESVRGLVQDSKQRACRA